MCTCGIDMATQQATPAMNSSAMSALTTAGVPRVPLAAARRCARLRGAGAAPRGSAAAWRRRRTADADMGRPPALRGDECCTIGGQMVPAR